MTLINLSLLWKYAKFDSECIWFCFTYCKTSVASQVIKFRQIAMFLYISQNCEICHILKVEFFRQMATFILVSKTRLKRLSVLDREIWYFRDFCGFLRRLGFFDTFEDVKLVIWHQKSLWMWRLKSLEQRSHPKQFCNL